MYQIFIITYIILNHSFQSFHSNKFINDERDGQEYKIVQIGDQWWMAENLNFRIELGSWYYDDDSIKHHVLGRFYTYESAMQACPVGWHLPSDEEWKILEMQAGLKREQADAYNLRGADEGENLKAKGDHFGDYPNLTATNKTGFSAIGSGYRNPNGEFKRLFQGASFWASTNKDSDNAWFRTLHADRSDIHRGYCSKNYGYNVRCVKD